MPQSFGIYLLTLFVLLAWLAGCAAPRRGAGRLPPARELAVAVETREYLVTIDPDQEREDAFMAVLSAAAERAAISAGPDTGFSYTLNPSGAVYPLSRVEVSCLVRGRYASGKGKRVCAGFFARLASKLRAKGF